MYSQANSSTKKLFSLNNNKPVPRRFLHIIGKYVQRFRWLLTSRIIKIYHNHRPTMAPRGRESQIEVAMLKANTNCTGHTQTYPNLFFINTTLCWFIQQLPKYSKTCVKRPLKIDKTNILMTNGSSMKVKSIAECSPWSILQYFDLH